MPLKPIYEKSPLMALTSLPLRPGMVRIQQPVMERLYALASRDADVPVMWEGLFRLACVLKPRPQEEPVYALVLEALGHQAEDGGLPVELPEALAVMRAAWAMYEHEAKRSLLEKMALWCGWLHEHWAEVMACAQVRTHSADLMELLENLYRVTGKKAIAALCDRLRQQAMDWSGILHTFAVQRPMSRITPWKDMEAGLEAEGGDEAGFYTRQYLACHGESLADGARACMAFGRFSGNGRELSAGKAGWEKISRYHGAVCGGVTADATLGGASPSVGVDAASLGAWAEVFSVCGTEEEDSWAYDAAETLLCNGLPAAVCEDTLVPFQRVNSLAVQCGVKDCYHACEDREHDLHAVSRLLRGFAALASTAVTLKPQGIRVNLFLPGRYVLPLQEGSCAVTMTGEKGQYALSFAMKKPLKASIEVRIPTWTKDACVTVNSEGGREGKPGDYLTMERTWQDGDVLRLSFAQELRVTEGHHQSALIRLGPQVMAYAPDETWAVALCGQPSLQDGKVIAPLRRVPEWHRKGQVPADLPVLPETAGEIFQAELVPYAEAPCRIALFPRGREA